MKREVPPAVGIVVILAALALIEFLYWQGLLGSKTQGDGSTNGRASPRSRDHSSTNDSRVGVTTLAGSPDAGWADGPADEARFDGPAAVALDASGALYVADSRNHCVRKISSDGQVTTLAGAPGKAGCVDGPGGKAHFFAPAGLALAPDGSIFVADTGNHRIRRIALNGTVTTYAGGGSQHTAGAGEGYRDGPAAQAAFRYPVGLAVNDSGVLYVADTGNRRLRRVSTDGDVETVPVAETNPLKAPSEVALDPEGRLWVSDTATGDLWMGPPEGPLTRLPLDAPQGGPVKPAGIAAFIGRDGRTQVYVADAGNHCLWEFEGGALSAVAGQPGARSAAWEDANGSDARFSCPAGLAVGRDYELFVADFGNNCVRHVSLDGRRKGVG
jgi:sugar lactone lactonase YvrE